MTIGRPLAVRVPPVPHQQIFDLSLWAERSPYVDGPQLAWRRELARVCLDALDGHLGALEIVEARLRYPAVAAWIRDHARKIWP